MTWIDNSGEVRPQSWDEYVRMKDGQSDICSCLICMRIRKRGSQVKTESAYKVRKARPSQSVRLPKPDPLPRMRIRLFRADPHCFWCGVEVQLERMTIARKDNLSTLATVDHLYSRWHPERKTRHTNRESSVLHVLACHGCNQERAGAEIQMRPFIPKLKERLSFAQQADATLARKVEPERVRPKPLASATESRHAEHAEPPRSTMRVICSLKEAVEFAKENPSR